MRLMLSLCRMSTNSVAAAQKQISGFGYKNAAARIGAPIAAMQLAIETVRVIPKQMLQTIIKHTATSGIRQARQPTEVDTALPPLNFRKIERQCPMMAAAATNSASYTYEE